MFDQPEPKPNKFVVLLKVLAMIGIVAGCGYVLHTRMQEEESDPAEKAARAEAEARKTKDQMLAKLAADHMADNADELEGKAVALEVAAESLRGDDQTFCRGAASVLRKLIPVTKSYRDAFEMGTIYDVMDVSSVKSRGDIKLRLEHLAHLRRVIDRQEAQFKMLEHNLRKEFRELGAPIKNSEALVKMAMTSFGPAAKKRMAKWQIQRTACTHSQDAIKYLDDHWGQWAVVEDEIVFEEERHTRKYNGFIELVAEKLAEDQAFEDAKKDLMTRG